MLERAVVLLIDRLRVLKGRLDPSGGGAWQAYLDTVIALATLLPSLTPERRGSLLTTAEMAQRLRISPKTLLKRKRRGEIRPTVERGRLIRWRGTEGQR